MAKYLNDTGLSYLWGKLTTLFMKKSDYVTAGGAGKVLAAADSDALGGVAATGYAKEISGQTELLYSDIAESDSFPVYDVSATTQKKISWFSIVYSFRSLFMLSNNQQTALTAIADADTLPVYDADEFNIDSRQKKSTWSNIKSVLKTYFDTLYPALAHKTRHATGGADALTAADIGAQASIGAASGILKANGSGVISAATAGTDYAAAITVTPSTSTTPTISTAATGTIYTFSNALTSLTISANPSGSFWYRIDFTAGATFNPTYAATPTWNGGTAPTITNGKKYSLIITNHISSYAEA